MTEAELDERDAEGENGSVADGGEGFSYGFL